MGSQQRTIAVPQVCYRAPLQEERVASVLNDIWEWLYRAEEARKAAEQLTDPDAKQCMLQLGDITMGSHGLPFHTPGFRKVILR